jgi:hypothetical protein
MFLQMPASQAQATVDVSKITCEDYFMDKITFSQYIVMWLSGYYNGKRNNTIIDPDAAKKMRRRSTAIATNTAKQRSWMPSRACSALINEFTQPWINSKTHYQREYIRPRSVTTNFAWRLGLLFGCIRCDVRYWHKADISRLSFNVRFRG